jgi:hypothetical protein
MIIARDNEGFDVSQIHFYPFNKPYYDALPGFLKHRASAFATDRLLRRLTVGLGYFAVLGVTQAPGHCSGIRLR